MQRLIDDVPAKRALLLAAAFLLLFTCPSFAETDGGKDTLFSFQLGGRERSWLVHRPPSYNPGKSWPVVLVFHGGGGSGEQMARMTGFNKLSDKEGFIVVYPNGTGLWQNRFLTWNAGNCCAYAYENHIDDVGFVRALIAQLKKD